MSKKEFKYEIVKQLAVLQEKDGYTKEINLIKYGDLPVCLDIRKWNRNDNTMQKGITITAEEFAQFKEVINSLEEVK
jgi:hypothetical protein